MCRKLVTSANAFGRGPASKSAGNAPVRSAHVAVLVGLIRALICADAKEGVCNDGSAPRQDGKPLVGRSS
jgi:hypothetical protein